MNANSSIRLVALGGLGEVGMNCMLIEHADTGILVDCGVTFPGRELGVDLIHPDFKYLLERAEPPQALIITHGHEDHAGATPFLLRHLNLPVYGPPYALALIKNRCQQLELPKEPQLKVIQPRERLRIGAFEFEPVRVTHSIPDTTCLVIRTPAGVVVHSGDFKIDPDPPDGQYFDEDRLQQAGREGVRLLLSDSTNVDVKGMAGSERLVAASLDERIARARGRVVVCLFGSNIHRMRAIFAAARHSERQVLLLGRSLRTHHRIAQELHMLSDPPPDFVWPEQALSVPRERLLVIATGTQGEPRAALPRLANQSHDALRLEEGDEVILSSRIIPGNERPVLEMMEKFERAGVRVWHLGLDETLHVSGHACTEEQRKMLELTRPRAFMPIHGSYHYLSRHADLARQTGVEQVLVAGNGEVVEVDEKTIRKAGLVPTGRVFLQSDREVDEAVLRDRKLLGETGIAVITLSLSSTGSMLSDPLVNGYGMFFDGDGQNLLSAAGRLVRKALSELEQPWTDDAIREAAIQTARAFFQNSLGYKPLVRAVVTRATQ